GFAHIDCNEEGRPPYPPSALLKLYLYGYLKITYKFLLIQYVFYKLLTVIGKTKSGMVITEKRCFKFSKQSVEKNIYENIKEAKSKLSFTLAVREGGLNV
ncbi:MAG: hypothetical protein JXJ22_13015, partial [Bacteroidales bacterium]|nr:hypothetical protein [Bacteroidales bacterium]